MVEVEQLIEQAKEMGHHHSSLSDVLSFNYLKSALIEIEASNFVQRSEPFLSF